MQSIPQTGDTSPRATPASEEVPAVPGAAIELDSVLRSPDPPGVSLARPYGAAQARLEDTFSRGHALPRLVAPATITELSAFVEQSVPDTGPTREVGGANEADPIAHIRAVQIELNRVGCSVGPVDGVLGRMTETGIRAFATQLGSTMRPDWPEVKSFSSFSNAGRVKFAKIARSWQAPGILTAIARTNPAVSGQRRCNSLP